MQQTHRIRGKNKGRYSTDTDTMSFNAFSYGDKIRYIGPEDLPGEWAAPRTGEQPYTFRFESMHGTLGCFTKFNGKKILAPEHPANNPDFWEQVK
jgi:hypothetical protein